MDNDVHVVFSDFQHDWNQILICLVYSCDTSKFQLSIDNILYDKDIDINIYIDM